MVRLTRCVTFFMSTSNISQNQSSENYKENVYCFGLKNIRHTKESESDESVELHLHPLGRKSQPYDWCQALKDTN